MNEKKMIIKEIKNLTRLLIDNNISISQNSHKLKDNKITWSGYKNIAFSLKDQPYEIIYNKCVLEKDYNFMLIDGGIIQLQYKFKRDKIESHILSFYPNPNFEKYQDNPEEFEELYFGNKLFTDILNYNPTVFPVRFDFSNIHTDVVHPRVHATFGNYKDCRIPISKPVSPNRFVSFILRNFYYNKFEEKNLHEKLKLTLSFEEYTTSNEKKLIYINYE